MVQGATCSHLHPQLAISAMRGAGIATFEGSPHGARGRAADVDVSGWGVRLLLFWCCGACGTVSFPKL